MPGNGVSILVVDDEPRIRAALKLALETEGYCVTECADKTQALRKFEASAFDLVVLGVRLGQDDGLDLVREFRGRRNVPVIMIAGKDNAPDRVAGLKRGADDYIATPIHGREVVSRIRNVLARYRKTPSEIRVSSANAVDPWRYNFDHCHLDALRRELKTSHGSSIELTDFEFRLLTLFVANPGRVLSRSEITRALNGHEWSPLDRTIDGHVARLRRKIERREDESRVIKSVRNVGYVFATQVSTG